MFSKGALSTSLPNLRGKNLPANGTKPRDPPVVTEGPFIIGVSGGTASGKTSVCDLIIKELETSSKDHHRRVALISQDCFYKSLDDTQVNVHEYNFDHPDAFDWKLMEETLEDLTTGKAVKVPIYDFVTHSRKTESTTVMSVDVVVVEGILAFYEPAVRDLMKMKVFVDTDADTRLARRILRDIQERGRDLKGVLHQYQKYVKPSFDEYILPTKKYADVIIPRGADNKVAINLIVQHIKTKLDQKAKMSKRNGLGFRDNSSLSNDAHCIFDSE